MSIDLTQLPPPDVLDYPNFEALLSERKAALIAACPEAIRATIAATLELESEPLTIDLEQSVYREYLLRERINTAVKATFLATATGADLDQFAAGRNIERKIIQAADPDAMPPVEAILESDAALRLRCQLFPEKLAAAGPRETPGIEQGPVVNRAGSCRPRPDLPTRRLAFLRSVMGASSSPPCKARRPRSAAGWKALADKNDAVIPAQRTRHRIHAFHLRADHPHALRLQRQRYARRQPAAANRHNHYIRR